MCGIAGVFDPKARRAPEVRARITEAMALTMAHRGPDQTGVWADPDTGVAFAHRRLSIVDLTDAGRQPMLSASARSVICYNGEVYNAEEHRALLGEPAPAWRGHSDTEPLLEACERVGVARAVDAAIGMFAFAFWDRSTRTMTLARDRLGIKPLFHCVLSTGEHVFASELRAFFAHPDFEAEVDPNGLEFFLRYSYVPYPHTVLRGVTQVPPGHIREIAADGSYADRAFWSLADVQADGANARAIRGDVTAAHEDALTDELEALLRDAISRRMIADVPLGAFLSGGYDSSTVAALMQAEASQPVRTFSIGFDAPGYNEAEHAAAVAAHLGTEHTELMVDAQTAQDVVPKLAHIAGEPFGDSSLIPTFLVSEMAREHVTVALSGDGGDELFAGYNRHIQGQRFDRTIRRIPSSLRRAAASGARALSPQTWERVGAVIPARHRPSALGDKIHKYARVLDTDDDAFHLSMTRQWHGDAPLTHGAHEPMTVMTDPSVARLVPDFVERMQYRDMLAYLPGDILTKVDRASMAASLEARVPLLDHRVVAFAWRLPIALKLREGRGKHLLRKVLYRHVPPHLLDRPKQGFAVPLDAWLRGPLRDWGENLLGETRLRQSGLLDVDLVRDAWTQHQARRENNQHALWSVLMWEAWRDEVGL